jgi:iron complex transport system permease protein
MAVRSSLIRGNRSGGNTTSLIAGGVRERLSYRVCVLAVLLILMLAGFFLSVTIGPVHIPLRGMAEAFLYGESNVQSRILLNVRLPRALVVLSVGVCLAISGGILQGVMRNPLASPNLIGISSGAGLMVILVLVVAPDRIHLITPFAFLGALATTVIIYVLAWRGGIRPFKLILAGVAVSFFLGAVQSTLMIFYPDRVHGMLGFMVGGLASVGWNQVRMMWPYAVFGLFGAVLCAKRLNILMLGDETATGLGLSVEKNRLLLIGLASLLAGSSVSVVGLLGFIGLIMHHLARMIVGSDYRILFPASALMGAALLTLCDTAARMVLNPVELPVGILTALIGAPFFLYLLRKNGSGRGRSHALAG